jgi:hypothetical protein
VGVIRGVPPKNGSGMGVDLDQNTAGTAAFDPLAVLVTFAFSDPLVFLNAAGSLTLI